MTNSVNNESAPDVGPLSKKRSYGGYVTILVSVILIIILLRQYDAKEVLAIMKKAATWEVFAATVLIMFGQIVLVTERWRQILIGIGLRLSFNEALLIRMGCSPLKFFFPIKSAELLKPVYLTRHHNMPFAVGVSSIVFDKVSVMVGMLPYAIVALLLSGAQVLMWGVAVVIIGLAALFIPQVRRLGIRISGIFGKKIHGFVEKVFLAFERVGPRRGALVMFYSTVIYGFELVLFFACLRAVGVDATFGAVLTAVLTAIFVGLFPISMSGIGTREATLVFMLGQGPDKAAVLAGGLLFSLIGRVLIHVSSLPWFPTFFNRVISKPAATNPVEQTDQPG